MRSIGRILRAFIAFTLLAALASAVGAYFAKGRLVSRGGPGDDDVDLVAIYEGLDVRSTAPALRRAVVTAWYSGGTLDLREATLDPAGATMTLRAIFGGCRLVVPETWRIELRAKGVFGGIGDARQAELVDPGSPLLVIEGFALFGGVGIVSEAPDFDKAETLPVEPAVAPA